MQALRKGEGMKFKLLRLYVGLLDYVSIGLLRVYQKSAVELNNAAFKLVDECPGHEFGTHRYCNHCGVCKDEI